MSDFKKQVKEEHYNFLGYVIKERWISYWHQIVEVLNLNPKNLLFIGVGDSIVSSILKEQGIELITVDIDANLNPDIVASIDKLPFLDNTFEVAIACQILEHIPYESSLKGIQELVRVCKNSLIISLPNQKPCRRFYFSFPYIRQLKILVPPLFFKPKNHLFDGEHYWELNAQGYEIDKFMSDLRKLTNSGDIRNYRIFELPYHHFFIVNLNK